MRASLTALAFLVALTTSTQGQSAPSGIRHFEPVTVVAGAEGAAHGSSDELGQWLSLHAFGRRFDLDIEPNDRFTRGSTIWLGDAAAAASSPALRLYKGRLRGAGDSWVRIGLIDGALHAMIWTPDEVITVQPLGDFDGSGSRQPVAYRNTDVDSSLLPPATCGLEGDDVAAHMGVPHELLAQHGDGGSAQAPTLREAGVVVVADYEYYAKAGHGAESDADLRYLISLVDAIYEREVNVSLAVSATIIFTNANDPFTGSSPVDAGTALDQLSAFRNTQKYCANAGALQSCTSDAGCGGGGPCVTNSAYGSDLTHLVTNRDLNGSTIGIAWIGAVCSGYYGAGVSQDYSSSTFSMSLLLAHEMGHNFNAGHDATSNPCGDPYPRYIMQPCLSSAVIDQFSSASKNVIIPYAQNLGCLSAAGTPGPTFTPTPTATPAPPTATRTRTPTRTATNTPTRTATQTATFTSTPTQSASATATVTLTRTPSHTPTATLTHSQMPTATHTNTFSPTATLTRTATPSMTPTHTSTSPPPPTSTPTRTASDTPSPTHTPVPSSTSTATESPTATPTRTHTPTATPSHSPSLTATRTATFTPTATATHSATHTATETATVPPTVTATATPTGTFTVTATATDSPTPTSTAPPSSTMTPTESPTATMTRTLTPTGTATHTPTLTATRTFTRTATATATHTRTATATSTATATVTPSRTATPVPSTTFTATASPTHSPLPTSTPVPSNTPTVTQTPTHTQVPSATATRSATRTATITPSATVVTGPAAFSGLVLWLDASQLTGLANGAALGTWPDQSGGAHHATQNAAASRPTYQVNAVNGNPVVRFDGDDDYLNLAGEVVGGASARTVFVVGRPTIVGNRGFIDLGGGAANGAAFMLTPEYGVRVRGGRCEWAPGATPGSTALYVVQLDGSTTNDLSAWVDGSLRAVTASQNETIRTSGSGVVGGWAQAPTGIHSFAGDLAEVVVYDRALSAAERQNLEQHLSAKYGLDWQDGGTSTATPTAAAPIPPSATPTRTATAGVPPSPTPTASGPQAVPDLVLWLDAHSLSGLNDGEAVSTWSDASGLNHHATQGANGQRPTYRATALNGAPALRFDGSNDALALAGTIVSGAQPRTVFFVVRPNVGGNRSIVDLGNGGTAGGGFQISPELAVRINGGSRVWTPGVSTTAPTLGVVQLTGTTTDTLNLWVDGVARAATSTASATIQTAGSGTVGRWTAGGNHFDGDIAEIIVYRRALTTNERQAVEQYLTSKYALGGTPSPSSLNGLQLWLDAAQLGALPADAPVASWPDASGNGHSAAQPNTTHQPTYQPTGLNGRPALRFDGLDDHLALSGAVVSGNQSRTVVWVAQPTIVGNRGIVDLGNGATTGGAFLVTPEHGVRVMGGNRLWSPAASTSAPSLGVVTFEGTGTGDVNAWVNGSALGVASTAATAIQTNGVGTVGAWSLFPAGANNFAGDLAEILVYDRVLSVAERQNVEQHLRAKYGL